jgi:hypothetical protein
MANSKTRSISITLFTLFIWVKHNVIVFRILGRSEVLQQPVRTLRAFVCPKECGRSYTNKWGLKQHLLECGVPPQYQCPMCISCFKRADHLKVHAKRVHGIVSLVTENVIKPIETELVDLNQSKGILFI